VATALIVTSAIVHAGARVEGIVAMIDVVKNDAPIKLSLLL